jgi:putative spermidine/putrescine transport system permease protein
MAVLISPMIVPVVLVAVGVFLFYAELGLASGYAGMILAHTALAAPFVVITVSASLAGLDATLLRAASSLGASPRQAFFRVVLPLILPGVVSGALFAFVTSFDEVVVVLFLAGPEQVTLPRKMFTDIREEINPATTAVATLLFVLAVVLMAAMEMLRRRAERLRNRPPGAPAAAPT